MGQGQKPVQIRSLPRSNENPKTNSEILRIKVSRQFKGSKQSRLIRTYLIVAAVVFVAAVLLLDDESSKPTRATLKTHDEAATPEALVNKYLYEAQLKHQMEQRTRDLENRASVKPLSSDAVIIPESTRPLGVSLEQENAAEKVYNDLYGSQLRQKGPVTPQDRINARIEQEKYLGELERQERKQFVQNFLKQAYDAGYDVQLDSDLVVVRVKKITEKPKMSLDKVLENLSRKGY